MVRLVWWERVWGCVYDLGYEFEVQGSQGQGWR